jgi:hypothetical protein
VSFACGILLLFSVISYLVTEWQFSDNSNIRLVNEKVSVEELDQTTTNIYLILYSPCILYRL